MKTIKLCATVLLLLAVGNLVGCSKTSTKSPDVSESIRKSLDQAGLKAVSVTQDRDKGVVTLGGNVATDGEKTQAGSIAASIATGQVVANQIARIIFLEGNPTASKLNAINIGADVETLHKKD